MRDKHWSKELRRIWPEYTKVRLPEQNFCKRYTKRFKWCETQKGRFWCCGAGRCWYFECRRTAFLFKLTWGGLENDE